MRYTIETEAVVGDVVEVRNYRKANQPWEAGTVGHVSMNLWPDGGYHVSYDVTLDRKSAAGNWIRVTVGDSGIRRE